MDATLARRSPEKRSLRPRRRFYRTFRTSILCGTARLRETPRPIGGRYVAGVVIVDVTTHPLSLPLHSPFVTALRTTSTVQTLVVEVIDDDGNRGFGEAPQVWQVTGESVAGADACVSGPLAAVIIGRDPGELVTLLREVRGAVGANVAAKAAVDVAVHDLVAHQLGIPLVRLLGGTATEIATDVTLPVGSVEELAGAAGARVDEGFDVLKVKVGTDPDGDVRRVIAIREAVGPLVRIRLDANQGWTERHAVRTIRSLEDADANVELVEQPVVAHDLDALARVTARVDTPILADESVYGLGDLLEVIKRHAADMVNVKLAKCGGLAVARTLLELATAAGMGTIVGSMMETPVGVGAAASLVAAYGTSATSDLDAAWWLARPPRRDGVQYRGSTLVLPDAPGLGIADVRDLRS